MYYMHDIRSLSPLLWLFLNIDHRQYYKYLMPDYRSSGGGAVILDDCNFHESVHLDSFDIDRTLTLVSSLNRLLFLAMSFLRVELQALYLQCVNC